MRANCLGMTTLGFAAGVVDPGAALDSMTFASGRLSRGNAHGDMRANFLVMTAKAELQVPLVPPCGRKERGLAGQRNAKARTHLQTAKVGHPEKQSRSLDFVDARKLLISMTFARRAS